MRKPNKAIDRLKLPIFERQSLAGNLDLPQFIDLCKEVTVSNDVVPMSLTTSFPCQTFSVSPKSKKPVLFYVAGTGSAVFYPVPTKNLCSHLAKELDCHVILIINERSVYHLYPEPNNEVIRAINYYLYDDKRHNLNIDREKVALGGYSSGCLLDIQDCLYTLATKKKPIPIRQLVLLAPVTDLSKNVNRETNNKQLPGIQQIVKDIPENFIAKSISPSHPMISPVKDTLEHLNLLPPVIGVVGENDFLGNDIKTFFDLLPKDKATLIKVPGYNHGFPWVTTEYLDQLKAQFDKNFKQPTNKISYNSKVRLFQFPENYLQQLKGNNVEKIEETPISSNEELDGDDESDLFPCEDFITTENRIKKDVKERNQMINTTISLVTSGTLSIEKIFKEGLKRVLTRKANFGDLSIDKILATGLETVVMRHMKEEREKSGQRLSSVPNEEVESINITADFFKSLNMM